MTEALSKQVFPHKAAEAKVLYKHGHTKTGILSRQLGEPITNFVSRRRRWWNMLKACDPTMELSETIRGDLLLESAKLKQVERLLVLTSTGNDRRFDTIAKAMLEQHALIHIDENGTRHKSNEKFRSRKRTGRTRRGRI